MQQIYYLDGYNLLFTLTDSDHPLMKQRHNMIRFLQKRFALLKMKGLLIFDGRVRHGEESGRSYRSPLEIIYTLKGQSADEFIEENIETAKNPRLITVVTNDRSLLATARYLGAKTIGNTEFMQKILTRKQSKSSKIVVSDTQKNIERLLIIFEKKLMEETEE